MNQDLPHIYTVSSLTREIRGLLETRFTLVWVSGEVSNLARPVSGHLYFTLKDAGAQIRAVLFRGNAQNLRYKPQDGAQVLCRGRLSVYEPRGEYQIIVDYLEPLGLGALAQAFEALKARLQAEGLFEAALKKPLPFLPRRLALVTSPTGAVVRDFLRLQKQRFPEVEVLIYPVKVQGAAAAPEIVAALQDLGTYPGVEVIILARGGGSLEDLWPFNEEMVARAIHRCPIPVVSAVGHEVDFTIADFVADQRAPTPSAAVGLVLPDKAALNQRLQRLLGSLHRGWQSRLQRERRDLNLLCRRLPDLRRRLQDLRLRVDDKSEQMCRRLSRRLQQQQQHLHLCRSRLLLLSPRRSLRPLRLHLKHLAQRLEPAWRRRQQQLRRHLEYCLSHLQKLDPQAILGRGYAIATRLPENTVILDALEIPPETRVRVRVARGRLDCRVLETAEEKDRP